MKKRVLVTGGAGFIGSVLTRGLLDRSYEVTVLDDLSTGFIDNIPSACDFIEMDISNIESYKKIPNIKFDAIMHLAAQSSGEKSFENPWCDFNSHVVSTFLLLEFCRERDIRRFLYASSMSVYGDQRVLPVSLNCNTAPKTFYGAGKLSSETYINLYSKLGIDTTIFRMFSVYGPNQNIENKMQGMVSIFMAYMLEDNPIIVKGSKDRFRDFVYIDDVIKSWMTALNDKKSFGKTYNLGTGKKTTVEQLIDVLINCYDMPDYPVEYSDGTPGDQFGLFADISSLKNDLSWKPETSLNNGIKKMFDFYKNIVS